MEIDYDNMLVADTYDIERTFIICFRGAHDERFIDYLRKVLETFDKITCNKQNHDL